MHNFYLFPWLITVCPSIIPHNLTIHLLHMVGGNDAVILASDDLFTIEDEWVGWDYAIYLFLNDLMFALNHTDPVKYADDNTLWWYVQLPTPFRNHPEICSIWQQSQLTDSHIMICKLTSLSSILWSWVVAQFN